MSNQKKVLISVIHNNNSKRLQSINWLVNALSKKTEAILVVNRDDICWQPDVLPLSRRKDLMRNLMYSTLSWQWVDYIGNQRKTIISLGLRLIYQVLRFRMDRKLLAKGATELIVTSKHIRAWENFLESGNDFLVVFEDDAILREDSCDRFIASVLPIFNDKSFAPLYVDIAGGIKIDRQRMNIPYGEAGDKFIYDRPLTNTACGYIIDRELCGIFISEITSRPYLRYIGVDWMINKVFIDLVKRKVNIKCVHFEPSIFEHGSMVGTFRSWSA